MHETLKRIANEAAENLKRCGEEIDRQARASGALVLEAERNLNAVVAVAKDIPDKLLSKFSYVMAGKFEAHEENTKILWANLQMNSFGAQLHGIFGAELPKGEYRIVVLLERVK